ncbi:Hypothetical predicted protein [Marmota monax]|uniref:Uncharacterized protein n=1 Tax=Marmota monax TaxID=9995 RepID=A0A5E4B989_MARMO|nr:hypothetical protein GHT09_019355 [Marmota monax]VTJ66304.1 Hypothetical predicted protein [Marmota monax]
MTNLPFSLVCCCSPQPSLSVKEAYTLGREHRCSPFLRRNAGSLPPVWARPPHRTWADTVGVTWKENAPEEQS